jgi:hypothetical protein
MSLRVEFGSFTKANSHMMGRITLHHMALNLINKLAGPGIAAIVAAKVLELFCPQPTSYRLTTFTATTLRKFFAPLSPILSPSLMPAHRHLVGIELGPRIEKTGIAKRDVSNAFHTV